MIETLKERVNADARLVHRARFLSCHFLLGIGEENWLVRIHDGKVEDVAKGPFVMPHWSFALRAPAEAWAQFWSADPPPGFHDLFALIRFGRLKAEGDLQPFMANLFYFKGLLASLRAQA